MQQHPLEGMWKQAGVSGVASERTQGTLPALKGLGSGMLKALPCTEQSCFTPNADDPPTEKHGRHLIFQPL